MRVQVALLRAEAGRRLVGTELLSVLSELASSAALLPPVDDAQWIAAQSAAASSALRWLGAQPVRVVVSLRAQAALPGFLTVLDDRQLRRLKLGPLSVAALQRIVADRLGVTFPRPTLVKLASASKGSAFYALEIAPLLAGRDADALATAPLPVPDDLRTLAEGRIAPLPSADGRCAAPHRGACPSDLTAGSSSTGAASKKRRKGSLANVDERERSGPFSCQIDASERARCRPRCIPRREKRLNCREV